MGRHARRYKVTKRAGLAWTGYQTVLLAWLGILVCFEVRCGHVAPGASCRHIHFGAPQDGVHYHSAEFRNAPVAVVMGACEAKAAAAVGPVDGPGDGLLVRGVLWQHRRQDRRYALIVWTEADS